MPLTIGDLIPQFQAFDVITEKEYYSTDYSGQILVLAFEGFSWCPICGPELWALQKVWDEYQNTSIKPRVQVIVAASGLVIGSEEDPAYIKNLAESWGLTFPILNDPLIVSEYSPDEAGVIFIINTSQKICNILTSADFPDFNDNDGNHETILKAIVKCGAPYPGSINKIGNWAALANILFGVIQDGGGFAYGPGGQPIPVDPLRISVETRDILTGLGISELAKMISDKKISNELIHKSLTFADKSLQKLIAKSGGLPEKIKKAMEASQKLDRKI